MERNVIAKRVSIWGIIGNVFLFIIKIIVGLVSKSQSMIADSFNSLGDIIASFMTWIGNKIASVPNDNDHNFGHGKAEYIFSMLISISMIIVSLKLLYDSVLSIIDNNHLLFSWNLIIVCGITFITKLILYIYSRRGFTKSQNLLLKANMLDHRNDMIITFFTTISIFMTQFNIYFVDGIVGIGISIWIFITGIKIFKESYDVLMDTSLTNEEKQIIKNLVKSFDKIEKVGAIYSIPVGYEYIVVIIIYVDGKMNTIDSHNLADMIEKKVAEEQRNIKQVIVHVEPNA